MKKRLSRNTLAELKEWARTREFPRGYETNRDHENCPAGEDKRSRLYYKITDDGKMLLAHCFNCGCSGAVKVNVAPSPTDAELDVYSDRGGDIHRYNTDSDLWDAGIVIYNTMDFNEWPLKYFHGPENGETDFIINGCFGIRATGGWVVIPRGYQDGMVTGYDCRNRFEKKYTRNIHPDYKDLTKLLIYNTSNSKTAIICEDPISAMKISLAGYAGVSLCGTHLTSDDAFKLGMLYDIIIMWLDNDKPEVMAKATENASKLKLYNNKVYINYLDSDPKKYTLDFIRSQVKGISNE